MGVEAKPGDKTVEDLPGDSRLLARALDRQLDQSRSPLTLLPFLIEVAAASGRRIMYKPPPSGVAAMIGQQVSTTKSTSTEFDTTS